YIDVGNVNTVTGDTAGGVAGDAITDAGEEVVSPVASDDTTTTGEGITASLKSKIITRNQTTSTMV
ncbi:hypothetical protein SNEBB_002863, partial [Seison nebaliae]